MPINVHPPPVAVESVLGASWFSKPAGGTLTVVGRPESVNKSYKNPSVLNKETSGEVSEEMLSGSW